MGSLKEHYEEIKVAFESGQPDDAHGPLHDIGHVLEQIPKLAGSELPEDQAEEAMLAVAQLFDAYGQVDDAMHKNEEPDYAAVAEAIDASMATLEKAVPDES